MKTYTVKTRNWHGRRLIASLLNLSVISGVEIFKSHDHDHKYLLQTHNSILAWAVFAYFFALRRFSGGWTYIQRPGNELKPGYHAIN